MLLLELTLRLAKKPKLSLTREVAADRLFDSVSPYHILMAETLLDQLWEEGVVINMGEHQNYRYKITEKGEHYLQKLLVYNNLQGVRK